MYLKCPLCGKLAHMSCFNPEDYSDDIECVEMRGLGRGRGFEVTSRFSALGDEELMDMISSRCHVILRIVGEEVTEKSAATALEKELGEWRKEALRRRGVDVQLKGRIVALQESVEEYEDQVVELQGSVDKYEEEADGLLADVNGVLTEVYEEKFSDLASAVGALIVEYNEALEEEEEGY